MADGPIQQQIQEKLKQSMDIEFLEVINESSNHNVPEGSESHFKLTIVSPSFEGKNLLAQHRQVNAILQDELSGQIHALALHTYTPEEWKANKQMSPESPACLGGGKD